MSNKTEKHTEINFRGTSSGIAACFSISLKALKRKGDQHDS
jgi:hypothetical protein